MGEFELIQRYFGNIPANSNAMVALGIGDDAALLDVTGSSRLAVSMDTMNLGTHFEKDWPAAAVAHRALAANLSDMAAMGARPKALLLSLSLPDVNEPWLLAFSHHLKQQLDSHHVLLIGGDTVKGPLSISMTIIGEILQHDGLMRHGAKAGDLIYLSGSIGDNAYAISQLGLRNLDEPLFQKLLYPEAQIALGLILPAYASSAIDVSDGLLQDLGHLLKASNLGAQIYLDKLPLGKALIDAMPQNIYELALSSGEEYELCFTVSEDKQVLFERELQSRDMTCHCIGVVDGSSGIRLLDKNNSQVHVNVRGYQHFE